MWSSDCPSLLIYFSRQEFAAERWWFLRVSVRASSYLRPLNLSSSKSSPISQSPFSISCPQLWSLSLIVFLLPISSLLELFSVTPYSRFYIDRLFSLSLSRDSQTSSVCSRAPPYPDSTTQLHRLASSKAPNLPSRS